MQKPPSTSPPRRSAPASPAPSSSEGGAEPFTLPPRGSWRPTQLSSSRSVLHADGLVCAAPPAASVTGCVSAAADAARTPGAPPGAFASWRHVVEPTCAASPAPTSASTSSPQRGVPVFETGAAVVAFVALAFAPLGVDGATPPLCKCPASSGACTAAQLVRSSDGTTACGAVDANGELDASVVLDKTAQATSLNLTGVKTLTGYLRLSETPVTTPIPHALAEL